MLRLDTHALTNLNNTEADRIEAEKGDRPCFEVRQQTVLGNDGQITKVCTRTTVVINGRYLKPETGDRNRSRYNDA